MEDHARRVPRPRAGVRRRVLLIYILMVYQTGSYLIPLVQMISIPLTVIGIMPGFWLLNVGDRDDGRRATRIRSTSPPRR